MFTSESVIRRPLTAVATVMASLTLVAGLAACGGGGGDGDDAGASPGNSGTDTATAFAAVKDKASGAGYTCVELKSQEDPATGLADGLSCIPGVDRIGQDPTFTVFGTGAVATGTEVAEKAADKMSSGSTGAGLDASVIRNMYATVDGDGVAGYCLDTDGNCADILTPFGLTVAALDGSMSVEENVRQEQDEAQRQQDEEQRRWDEEQQASEEAEAQATAQAQTYSGWDDVDAAVDQMDAWGVNCADPDNENGMWGTTCGGSDDALFFGDRDRFVGMAKEQGITDDQLAQMLRVSDGDWTLMCRPTDRGTCDEVAERTGRTVEQGL